MAKPLNRWHLKHGFTLIEVIIFIVVTGILASSILLAINASSSKTPSVFQTTIATQAAQQCMEWYLGQRRLNGYSSITCPSTTVPSFCNVPSGYAISVNVSCTTINGDTNYQTITINVSGNGNANMSTLIAKY